jgi:methylated-DNA-protein-cysteine methyltransferase-like protein
MSPGYTSPPNKQEFNQRVWEVVRQIPPGKVTTYGRIAEMIAPPGDMNLKDYLAFGARWVGGAMAGCPADVPWQRVINAQGKISLRRGADADAQRQLLEAEGVQFDERGRVDFNKYLWEGLNNPSC